LLSNWTTTGAEGTPLTGGSRMLPGKKVARELKLGDFSHDKSTKQSFALHIK